MKLYSCFFLTFLILFPYFSLAGPYPPAAGKEGTTAIHMGDPAFIAWATQWENPNYGAGVDDQWKTPDKALGPAQGNSFHIVSLGSGGSLTLMFALPIRNGDGWDFAVFENSFDGLFLELAYVEVSSNGIDFVRFPHYSQTANPVSSFGTIDTTNILGFAGKYIQASGTPFDLQDLATHPDVINQVLKLSQITHVRVVDVIGDGREKDSNGNSIYDPYPTTGGAGFDLEAVGLRYERVTSDNRPPNTPSLSSPPDQTQDVSLTPLLESEPFDDPDEDERHLYSHWQIANHSDFEATQLIFQKTSITQRTSISIPSLILQGETTYYWRTRHYDGSSEVSAWSNYYEFTTQKEAVETTRIEKDWDGDGQVDSHILSIQTQNSDQEDRVIGLSLSSSTKSPQVERLQTMNFSETSSTFRPTTLSHGLIGFRIQLDSSGDLSSDSSTDTIKAIVHLSEAASPKAQWYQYDRIHGWSARSTAKFNESRTEVTLELQEGSSNQDDVDGVKNQHLIHIGGVGFSSSEDDTTPEDDEGGIDDDEQGCFIANANASVNASLNTSFQIKDWWISLKSKGAALLSILFFGERIF